MEQLEGFVGTEELLFERPADTDGDTARRLVDKLLDLLLSAYNDSLRPRFRPNIWVDYVERIKDRLVVAANRDSRFASHTVTVVPHGHEYRPWQNYLEALRRDRAKIDSLAPPSPPSFTAIRTRECPGGNRSRGCHAALHRRQGMA